MRRQRDEDGVVIVLTALLMVATLLAVAIVIDLGQLRSDRQTNKRLSDSSAAAAVRDLPGGPWRAVCTAYQYALANAEGFTSFDSETWSTMATTPTIYSSTAGTCPSSAPYGALCNEADPATWAHFRGTARSGAVIVDIMSAYRLPDPSFAEDSTIAGDDGQPCDQVAVIVRESRTPFFGGVGGVESQSTRVRSVARFTTGPLEVAALVVLEQTACRAIDASTNGGKLVVHANGDTPGSIVVDSDGSGCSGGGQKVVEGSPLPSVGGPNVIAESTTSTPSRVGRISIFALNTNQTSAHTESCAPSSTPPASCSITPHPIRPPKRIGREILDERYRAAVDNVIRTADTTIQSMPSSYTLLSTAPGVIYKSGPDSCEVDTTVTVAAQNVYIDCDLLVQSTGRLRFTGAASTIVAEGTINVASSAASVGVLAVDRPAAVYVAGETSGSNLAINVGGSFIMNDGGAAACATPTNGNPTSKLVVRDGRMEVNGGAGAKLQLCQTAVVMADGWTPTAGTPPSGWPNTNGTTPFNNSFDGNIVVGGQGTVEWTAPNAVTDRPATASEWAGWLEDLTLWTETSVKSTIGGQGTVHLAGVFALPNAAPFELGGIGSQNIDADAQFWTRQLRLAGQALLEMAPNPDDSIPVIDYVLVR